MSIDARALGPIVPVVVIDDAARAPGLADALVRGGLPVAEVTFRTPAARDAIAAMSAQPDLLVGAGTVLTSAQADEAIDAGARFVVSPGLDEGVIRRCADRGVPVLPGVATATEVMAAIALGLDVVKFFPAEAMGGVATLRALAAAFPGLRFVPTGGIGPANLADYLACDAVLAVGGSWMVPRDAIAQGDVDRIAAACSQAVALARRP